MKTIKFKNGHTIEITEKTFISICRLAENYNANCVSEYDFLQPVRNDSGVIVSIINVNDISCIY